MEIFQIFLQPYIYIILVGILWGFLAGLWVKQEFDLLFPETVLMTIFVTLIWVVTSSLFVYCILCLCKWLLTLN